MTQVSAKRRLVDCTCVSLGSVARIYTESDGGRVRSITMMTIDGVHTDGKKFRSRRTP